MAFDARAPELRDVKLMCVGKEQQKKFVSGRNGGVIYFRRKNSVGVDCNVAASGATRSSGAVEQRTYYVEPPFVDSSVTYNDPQYLKKNQGVSASVLRKSRFVLSGS